MIWFIILSFIGLHLFFGFIATFIGIYYGGLPKTWEDFRISFLYLPLFGPVAIFIIICLGKQFKIKKN